MIERGTVEYMKASLWLLTLALAVMCFFLWALARLEIPPLHRALVQLPALTVLLVASPNWLWFCPVPWIVASIILSCRKEVSPAVGFLFLGTIAFAASLILFPFLLALAIPWLELFANSVSK
jgi:FtsH-binding integral membrane protein